MAQTEKTGARQIFIDKDRGAQIFVQASGGTYLALHNGVPTGFSPLKALADRAEDKTFLSLFIRQLVRADGKPISVQEERLIEDGINAVRSEEHTSELQSLMRHSYAVFCLKKKTPNHKTTQTHYYTHNK